jgi:hypothetical protein
MTVLHVRRVNRQHGAERRRVIGEMYLKGMTQDAIGKELGISGRAVGKHLARAREEWIARYTRDYAEKVAEELAGLELVMVRSWEAWERSKQPHKQGGPERTGDARFLEAVLRAREMRLKVLGALKGQQVLVNQVTVNWDSLLGEARAERGRGPDVIESKLAAIESRLIAESTVNGGGTNGSKEN